MHLLLRPNVTARASQFLDAAGRPGARQGAQLHKQ